MAFFCRSLVSKVAVGVGIVAGAAAYAAGHNSSAQNSCSNRLKMAYQNFMPAMDFPDLSKHNNCLANHLTPTLYDKLRNLVSNISFQCSRGN